jgi:hypothetical protein
MLKRPHQNIAERFQALVFSKLYGWYRARYLALGGQLGTVATMKTPPGSRRWQVALRYGDANKEPAHAQPSRTRKT